MLRLLSRCLSSALGCTALACTLFAVDGVVLIDHNRAIAGNVTPGDTPGYPVTISAPGSYRLSGNLTVPNAITSAIDVVASHVTIDLNGFAILGPVDCSGGFPCAGAPTQVNGPASGTGINAPTTPVFNITIRNGTIQGMGRHGIFLRGDSNLVEYVHVRSNGHQSISLDASADMGGSIVQHCTVQRNGGSLYTARGRVSNSTIDGNLSGVLMDIGVVSHNVITRNGTQGIGATGDQRMGYYGNVLDGNAVRPVSGGVNLGQNLCNGVLCP